MSAEKSIELFGLVAKVESSYGAGATVDAAVDGIMLAEESVAQLGYVHDGERGMPPGSPGTQKSAAPSGRSATFPWSVEYRGPGAAYSASVFADVHAMLRASGHTPTLDSTGGSEKYTYAPHALSTTPTSIALEGYGRGQKLVMNSGYASLDFKAVAGGFGMFSGDCLAKVASIADSSLAAITYNYTLPPKAAAMALSIGLYTGGIIREVEFKQNRVRQPRGSINATGGHAGYAVGRRAPTLSVLVEADSFATTPFHASGTLDPYALFEAGTSVAVGFTLGSVQYNRLVFAAATAQLAGPPGEEADGPTALWRLNFNLRTSTAILSDDYSWVTS